MDLEIQEYDYEIQYIKGDQNHTADFLSRIENLDDKVNMVSDVHVNDIDWKEEQMNDMTCIEIKKY